MLYTCILLKLTRIIFNSMLISWCIFLSLGSKQRRTEAADGRRWRWWLWTPCKLKKKHHHLIFTRNRFKKIQQQLAFLIVVFDQVFYYLYCAIPQTIHTRQEGEIEERPLTQPVIEGAARWKLKRFDTIFYM